MWDVKVRKITHVEPVANSDFLDLAIVGNGWPCVVKRGEWKEGDLCVYIPAESIVPPELLTQLGLEGKLSGTGKNRVKPVKLRGQVSIGIVSPAPEGSAEGDDMEFKLGIRRWEMPVPECLRGKIRNRPAGFVKYDIDNIRNENWFIDGEEVAITEKVHGTNASFGIVDGVFHACSRNMSLEQDDVNLYWKIATELQIEGRMRFVWDINPNNIWLHGEIFGKGVQDLEYGQDKPTFRLFDIRTGDVWFDYDRFVNTAEKLCLPVMPELFRGKFSQELVDQYTSGKESVSGKESHMREGIVVRPILERETSKGQRVILKSVGSDYLLRKGGTEFH